MTKVMAVSFSTYGRLYYVDPGSLDPSVGELVLVPTDSGAEVATVVWTGPGEVEAELPVCAGVPSAADLDRDAANRRFKAEAEAVAVALVAEHDLPMRIVGVDVDDRSAEFGKLVAVYYLAPHRVDFRALLRDLAAALKARIDLRQIGARDAARMLGGIGGCGRELCCSTFLPALPAVGMRMVKDQDLAGNLLQVQGLCGRLKCCLAFEQDAYEDFERRAPALGCTVQTPDGPGKVVARSVPCDSVTVRGGDGQRRTCPVALVSLTGRSAPVSDAKTTADGRDAD